MRGIDDAKLSTLVDKFNLLRYDILGEPTAKWLPGALNGFSQLTREQMVLLWLQNLGGTMGPVGPTGPAGPQGATGPQGPVGSPGGQGMQGVDGRPGIDGNPGRDGRDGVDGKDGTKFHIEGQVASSANLPTSGNVVGDAWIAADTNHIWMWDGTKWVDLGPLQGPKGADGRDGVDGARGADGARGPQGPTGSTGSTGPQGPAGPQGPTGATGATGPQGATGAPGAQGAPGLQGPQGIPGPVGPAQLGGRGYMRLGPITMQWDSINWLGSFVAGYAVTYTIWYPVQFSAPAYFLQAMPDWNESGVFDHIYFQGSGYGGYGWPWAATMILVPGQTRGSYGITWMAIGPT